LDVGTQGKGRVKYYSQFGGLRSFSGGGVITNREGAGLG
jgi:hypothetical protein